MLGHEPPIHRRSPCGGPIRDVPGQQLAALANAENQHVEVFRFGHRHLPVSAVVCQLPRASSFRVGPRHIGGTDALQGEPVADALVDDAAQLLGHGDARVACRQRRQCGDAFADLAGAGE